MRKLLGIAVGLSLCLGSLCLSSCSPWIDKEARSFDGEYQASNLPFTFSHLVVEKGGGYRKEESYQGGVRQPTREIFSGITLQGLTLTKHELLLASNTVSPDGKIATNEYGKLQLKFEGYDKTAGQFKFSVLVTPKQEKVFRNLLSE